MTKTISSTCVSPEKVHSFFTVNGPDEALRVTVSIADVSIKVFSNLKLHVTAENVSSEPLEMVPKLLGHDIFIDGQEADSLLCLSSGDRFEMVEPGQKLEEHIDFTPDFRQLNSGKRKSRHRADLVLYFKLRDKRYRNCFQTESFEIEIDYGEFQMLLAPDGQESNYAQLGDHVFYVSPYGRSFDNSHRKTAIDIKTCEVLNRQYIKDKSCVLRDGVVQRGVNPSGFVVLNRLFAGNQDIILTSYGKAKVEDPASFEVLDDGNQFVYADGMVDGYGAGYARDRFHVYFFCESTDTTHALRVRAAKNPVAFRSVGYAYGIDEKNVYLEGRVIKKADAFTWKHLGNGYSKDKNHAFFFDRIVPDADVDTFEVLDNYSNTVTDRHARDENRYYEGTDPCPPPDDK